MFIFSEFSINQHQVRLLFPDQSQAKDLIEQINQDRESLSRWMSWTKETNNVQDELRFIDYARQQNAKNSLLELTIEVDGKAIGMIDLHNISNHHHRAEVGYWLSSSYQGSGIVTQSLRQLIEIAFGELAFNKIIIMAESENLKSQAVAKRLGFQHEGTLREEYFVAGKYRDLEVYSMLAAEYKKA
ncbi:GNAT family N-acetyltransferase [Oenococcus kitaharae]|uniref:Ribosomal-protein-L7p-serine acetyltransferase n=1 Tax=Oenococcus kitaharae DSM 17330 TaxID=1045004 RepID=G9WG28_9LACO|nr:GNAT family protein [Oenococcus kitaharae]EHN59606.1 Ribosomal-protein-L7p-serine acetyltransferase [Oenococcus kitaharae DSM 17330]OEY83451.1 acetyltransferase [Oenococcus kitaharae]OEY85250.1 acetyltransferase [Oenococcus kitaharae]OEY86104.1 acetyltransferase [Oenococcus kitaharae]